MSILIITYEGTHNHPLPVSATGIASTTSAAASMLLSGSSNGTNALPSTSLNGLNFSMSNTNPNKHIPQHFQFPTSSSSHPNIQHPTVTLDLTSPYSNTPQFNLLTRSSMSYPSRYSSGPTSLNFASSTPSPLAWRNSTGNMSSYGNQQPNNIINSTFYQKTNNNVLNSLTSQPSPDTMTAALTADPSFQSALAAALTNIIGSRDGQLHDMLSGLHSRSAPPSNPPNAQAGRILSLGQAPFSASAAKSSSTSPSDSKHST